MVGSSWNADRLASDSVLLSLPGPQAIGRKLVKKHDMKVAMLSGGMLTLLEMKMGP